LKNSSGGALPLRSSAVMGARKSKSMVALFVGELCFPIKYSLLDLLKYILFVSFVGL